MLKYIISFAPLFVGCFAFTEPACGKFELEYKLIERFIKMEQELSSLKDKLSSQQRIIEDLEYKSAVSGSQYTRWGRTECPGNGTSLIYKGYMAGSNKDQSGTGSNYLCLPEEPKWGYYDETIESGGKITGTEYRFAPHKADGAAKFLGEYLFNNHAPCAVCHSSRAVSIMIPGRNVCYDGWTIEYTGYLVSGWPDHKRSIEYVCLDNRPERVTNGKSNDGDNRVYFVEPTCGKTLACPPYIAGRELACVVCTI